MATYFDICDNAFKVDSVLTGIKILRVKDGIVYEDDPTPYEFSMYVRNVLDSSVISKETAEKLALDPCTSYWPLIFFELDNSLI